MGLVDQILCLGQSPQLVAVGAERVAQLDLAAVLEAAVEL